MSSSGTHPSEKKSLYSATHCSLAHAGTHAKTYKTLSQYSEYASIHKEIAMHTWRPELDPQHLQEMLSQQHIFVLWELWRRKPEDPWSLVTCHPTSPFSKAPSQKLKVWCDWERHPLLPHTHARAPACTHIYTWEHTHEQQQKSACFLCRVWHCRRRSTVHSAHLLLITTRNLQHCAL